MSDLGKVKKESLLPDDLEQKVRIAQSQAISLVQERDNLEKDVEAKRQEKESLNNLINEANQTLDKVNEAIKVKNDELAGRETEVSQKESALGVYANALKVKEDKLNKYLAVFEGMKDVIVK